MWFIVIFFSPKYCSSNIDIPFKAHCWTSGNVKLNCFFLIKLWHFCFFIKGEGWVEARAVLETMEQ